MKCPKGRMKRRIAKPHGSHSHLSSLNSYKHSLKKHTWIDKGSTRHCANCDCMPRHKRGNRF